MKKLGLFVCVLLLLATMFSGCGKRDAEAPEAESEQQVEATEQVDAVEEPEEEVPAVEAPESSVKGVRAVRGIEFKKTGTFADSDEFDTYHGRVAVDEDRYSIVFKDGTTSEPVYRAEKLDGNYFVITNSADTANATGLVSLDGEVLIPCEAAFIEWIDDPSGEDRFLKVAYATEVTTNKEEAYLYAYDAIFSVAPGEEDVLYKGYARIYDVVNKQFVGDLQTSFNGYDAIQVCGDCIILEDADGMAYMYDNNGNLVMQTSKLDDVGNGYIICRDSASFEVYDTTGERRIITGKELRATTSTNGYLVNSSETLIDLDGNQVLPDSYEYIVAERNGIVEVRISADEYQLIRLDGEVLASTKEYIHITTDWGTGYYYFEEKGKYTLVGPEGIIAEGLESAPDDLCLEQDGKYLVLNEKKYSLSLDNDTPAFYDGLVKVQSDETGEYGLYELYNGQQLLDCKYEEIRVVYDTFVFARQSDTWAIFELVPQYR